MTIGEKLSKFSEKTRLKGFSKFIAISTTGVTGVAKILIIAGLISMHATPLLIIEILPIVGAVFAIIYQLAPETYNSIKTKLMKKVSSLDLKQKIEISTILSQVENKNSTVIEIEREMEKIEQSIGSPHNNSNPPQVFENTNEPISARTIYNKPFTVNMESYNKNKNNNNTK